MKITGLPSARAAGDQPPQPPAAVGGGRVAGVGPGRAGQHGRGLDQDQVGADALQHHVRVVRQQRVDRRVRGERRARFGAEHAGDDQPRRGEGGRGRARGAQAGRGQRGKEPLPDAGQVIELRRRQREGGRRPARSGRRVPATAGSGRAAAERPRDHGRRAARTSVRPRVSVAEPSSADSRAWVMASCSLVSRSVRASRSRSAARPSSPLASGPALTAPSRFTGARFPRRSFLAPQSSRRRGPPARSWARPPGRARR